MDWSLEKLAENNIISNVFVFGQFLWKKINSFCVICDCLKTEGNKQMGSFFIIAFCNKSFLAMKSRNQASDISSRL